LFVGSQKTENVPESNDGDDEGKNERILSMTKLLGVREEKQPATAKNKAEEVAAADGSKPIPATDAPSTTNALPNISATEGVGVAETSQSLAAPLRPASPVIVSMVVSSVLDKVSLTELPQLSKLHLRGNLSLIDLEGVDRIKGLKEINIR
jgi:hypothetical protein